MQRRAQHAVTPLKTVYGSSTLHCFSFGPHEEDNILVVVAGNPDEGTLVRVQSACYTAEILRSTDCDCHEQLHLALERIHEEGGLFVYMLSDGRGAGLLVKIRALALAERGLDTYEAYADLGVDPDPRSYHQVAIVLGEFNLRSIRLLTNNPRKVDGLTQYGFQIEREPLEIPATEDSRPYLLAKKKFGHLFSQLLLKP